MNKQLAEIKDIIEEISSKLGNQWKETIPFCHYFIDLDTNTPFLHRMYPSFYGQALGNVVMKDNGLTFQITTESMAAEDEYVWVSRQGKHTLMKVVDISPNGENRWFAFYKYTLEVVA